MTTEQYGQLRTEIQTDPRGLGYAALVAAGNDQGIADLLNATSGPSVGPVDVESLSRDEFLAAILPAVLVLGEKAADVQAKWDRLLGLARSANVVRFDVIEGVIALAVSDGLLTQTQADAIDTKQGSRAEVLFGAGTFVFDSHVSMTLREAK